MMEIAVSSRQTRVDKMLKALAGFAAGVAATGLIAWQWGGQLMFTETPSPFGMEETVARIQQNIIKTGNGWALSGLRNPARAVQNDGGNVLPVLMVEACSTQYSAPILKEDEHRILSILMPCKVTVYKKQDGKVYIGTMNAGLMGKLFGPTVAETMARVAEDQKKFLAFDPNTPAPRMIESPAPGKTPGTPGSSGGSGC